MARGVDVLDVITGTVAASFGVAAYATYRGRGVPAISTLLALFGAAYVSAPRRKFPKASDVVPEDSVRHKVAIVTGATSGIGIDTAGALYEKGAKVYLAVRNPQKIEEAKKEIMAKYSSATHGELVALVCDLSDLHSVQECVEMFLKSETKLDILINNAGIMALPERTPTKQGLESQVGVCHVGHFFLTTRLLPAIHAATKADPSHPARIVCLSSSAHRRHQMKEMLDGEKHMETSPYDPWVAYGNAKCCNLLFAKELSNRGLIAFSVMPGGIHTGLQSHVDWWTMLKWTVVTPFFFKSTSQGAATSLHCATKADAKYSGKYFDNCKPTDAESKAEDEAGTNAANRLWDQTEDVLKVLGF